MSKHEMASILHDVLSVLQVCLGVWQFMKLTPVGALIQSVIGWLVRPLGLSPAYSLLQHCRGRVFKRANCFVLQPDIPSDRRSVPRHEVHPNPINLRYLGSDFLLERKGEHGNTLFINQKMCYYITDTNWEKLQTLDTFLRYSVDGPPIARAAVARAAADAAEARAAADAAADAAKVRAADAAEADAAEARAAAEAAAAEAAADAAEAVAAEFRAAANAAEADAAEARAAAEAAGADAAAEAVAQFRAAIDAANAIAAEDRARYAYYVVEAKARRHRAYFADARATAAAAAANARAAAAAANARLTPADDNARAATAAVNARAADPSRAAVAAVVNARAAVAAAINARAADFAVAAARTVDTVFVKGNKEFWTEVITGGVMSLDEVFDALILYNQHVSVHLNNEWLLPVNLSVSEEKLLKILNLVALFLQTKKFNVHWAIPTSLSIISAVMEFNTRLRVWIYSNINMLFCCIIHFICDPLPRSCRRQIYSLGKWVENLTPCNDILLKVVRGDITAIITEGAKVHKGGAIMVPWLDKSLTDSFGVIEDRFSCEEFNGHSLFDDSIHIRCIYIIEHHLCEISAMISFRKEEEKNASKMSVFYVKCDTKDDFRHIITLVSCIAENGCGSLISCGSNNKVLVRGLEESVTSYVNSGLPPIYKLELKNVIVS